MHQRKKTDAPRVRTSRRRTTEAMRGGWYAVRMRKVREGRAFVPS